MKAVIWTKYGSADGLQLQEIDKPVPRDNEVLVKIHATTVTAGDCEMRTLKLPLFLGFPMRIYTGISKPTRIQIIGQEFAGEIEAAGPAVKRFKVGDQVFGMTGLFKGTYAEYICLPDEPGDMDGALAIKPTNMTYDEAAAVPLGGLEALHFLRQGDIQRGQTVLINGAGGSIGTIGVQLARYYGAEVTAVDSTGKLDMLRSLGAAHVVDYTREDFTKRGQTYDVIFDVVNKSSYSGCMRSLTPNGRYLVGNPTLRKMIRGQWTSAMSSRKVVTGTSSPKAEDLIFLKELIEAGTIHTVIDRRFPLEDIVEAHRYVETGNKKGNVVITVAQP